MTLPSTNIFFQETEERCTFEIRDDSHSSAPGDKPLRWRTATEILFRKRRARHPLHYSLWLAETTG